MKKRTKKIVFNVIVGLLVVVVLAWVAGKFIHLGNV